MWVYPRSGQTSPRSVGLLTTTDHVGLRQLLRLHDTVEDVAHLARQDHVLDAHAEHLDAERLDATTHVREDLRVQRRLVAEQLVERLRSLLDAGQRFLRAA